MNQARAQLASLTSLDAPWLDDALAAVARATVCVFGDLCLDAYWDLRTDIDERSIETGLPVQRVVRQTYSLGGASNVAANAKDLGAAQVGVIGMIGDDGFGLHLRRLMAVKGIDTANVIDGDHHSRPWSTPSLIATTTSNHAWISAAPPTRRRCAH